EWKLALLPTESLATGIRLPGVAPAVTTPVPVGIDQHLEQAAVLEHAAALTHRHVVSRVKAHGCQVAECAHLTALVGRSQRVAAVLDQPKLVSLREGRHRVEVKRVAQR